MTDTPYGLRLRLVLAAGRLLSPFVGPVMRRRLARGKEDPDRWREKLGEPGAPRPDGPLIWLHAVGLGEVMALRPLIAALAEQRPDLNFLVTSTARASGAVFTKHLPPRTRHQFLALDLPRPVTAFLDHWRPDLVLWCEQDLWPRLVVEAGARGIPQIAVNARMDARAYRTRARQRAAYRDVYARFSLLLAQDDATAAHLRDLAPADVPIRVTGSLKSAAALLADSPERPALSAQLAARRVWCAAPTHPQDEAIALAATALLPPDHLLILAPRDPARGPDIAAMCATMQLSACLRSAAQVPTPDTRVWIADTFGELGLWYRLSHAALIGGSFSDVEGHNPWEAVALGCAVLHGPRVANFGSDYAELAAAEAALTVTDADGIATALTRDLSDMAGRAQKVQAAQARALRSTLDALAPYLPKPQP